MSDIIDEVIRDKREETKMIYFKKSLPIVLGATIVIILGMIISQYRENNAKAHNQEIGDTIVNSLENLANDPAVAIEGLQYVQENAKNHAKDIGALQQVAIFIASNKDEEAISILENIIDNKEYQDLTRSYAKLTWISMLIDKKPMSDDTKSKIEKYFMDFTEKKAFFASAKLLEAIYYSESDKAKSEEIAKSLLSNKVVPMNIKEEASALISNLKIGK